MSESSHIITTHRITPDAFAAWLHAQGQEPSVHVLAWFKARGVVWPLVADTSAVVSSPLNKVATAIEPHRPCIEPLPGWTPNSKFGLLRSGQGAEDRLVRVEDVAGWLSDRLPRDHVVKELFAPLMHEEGQAASRLFVLRGGDFAVPLILGDRPNAEADAFWRTLPFTRADTRPEDVVRDVADAWAQAWPGHGQDPDVFYREGWIAHCKRMKSLARSAEGPHGWEEAYSDRYYINLEDWRHQCKDLLHSLGHLGVPFSAAHELWGWGTAPSAAQSVGAGADVPVGAFPFPLADFAALVLYRNANTKRVGRSKKGPSWALGNQIDVGKAELARRIEAGTVESTALNAMGRELGIEGAAPRTPLKRALFGSRKRTATAGDSPTVVKVRDGKKVA